MMLADSDVLIDFLRGKGPAVERMAIEIGTGRLHTTTITAFELLAGAKTAKDHAKVTTLLEALHVLPLDSTSAARAASVKRELEASGRGMATADCLIAGICLAQRATLLTRNVKHFEHVPGLKLGMKPVE